MKHNSLAILLPLAIGTLVAGSASAVMQYTLSDNYSSGPGGFAYNNLYFEAEPSREFSLDIYTGRTHTNNPNPDTTRSLGFGGWMALTPKLDLAVDYNVYNGARAQVWRLPTLEAVGESSKRERVGTLTGTLGLDLLKDASGAGEGEGAPETSAKLSLGAGSGNLVTPIFIERHALPPRVGWVEKELAPYAIRDTAYSAGLSLGMGSTTLSTTYRRHHYSLATPPPDASRPEIARMLDALSTVTIDALPPFPRYESGVKLRQGLPMHLAATAAYDYILSDRTGQVARYMTGEMAWEALSWMELRMGSYWDREYHATTRYTTAGMSLYF